MFQSLWFHFILHVKKKIKAQFYPIEAVQPHHPCHAHYFTSFMALPLLIIVWMNTSFLLISWMGMHWWGWLIVNGVGVDEWWVAWWLVNGLVASIVSCHNHCLTLNGTLLENFFCCSLMVFFFFLVHSLVSCVYYMSMVVSTMAWFQACNVVCVVKIVVYSCWKCGWLMEVVNECIWDWELMNGGWWMNGGV